MSKLFKQCPLVEEILVGRTSKTLTGEQIPVHSDIGVDHAEALYETILRTRPATVLEVGMAFGVSSLTILTALRDIGQNGKLISIDPVQSTDWKGCGLASIARAGLKENHQIYEDYDYNVLPKLLSSGLKINFAYIDGWHTFDYTLLDWWYVDRMLTVGGIAAFNDCSWPGVEKAIEFVLSHRKYTEIDVGLPVARQRKKELFQMLPFTRKEHICKRPGDRYLKKDENWEPRWDFYAPF